MQTDTEGLPQRWALVGDGRLGRALAAALRAAGIEATGPYGRGWDGAGADAVLLCVPDGEIAAAAAAIAPGPLVGHCSGATTLAPLQPHRAFSFHPLMTVPATGARFEGAAVAIAGESQAPRALAAALGMHPFEVADEDRAAYHAAASLAANFVVTLEGAAERLAATAGVPREALAPLVRAAVENWATEGAAEALTGPIARGDEETVERQRAAVEQRTPDQLALWDALVAATRRLAEGPKGPPGDGTTAEATVRELVA